MNEKEKKILIIDDEPNFVTQFKFFLESKGHQVVSALNAKEALEKMEKEDICVALADQRMPGTKGVELLSEIQKKYPSVVRALITGYSDPDAVIRAVNDGAIYRYISKKSLPEEIAVMVDQCLKKYQQDQEFKKISTANQRLLRMLAAEQNLSACGIFGREVSQKLEEIVFGLSGYLFGQAGKKDHQTLAHHFSSLEASLKRIRDLSQIMDSQEGFQREPQNLQNLIEHEVNRLSDASLKEKIPISLHLNLEKLPPVDVSSFAFIQLLKEIFENAVIFSPPHQKNIWIRASSMIEKEDPRIQLDIINAFDQTLDADKQKYFAPFFTTLGKIAFSQSSPQKEVGDYHFGLDHHYGIGLPFTQWLVCRHGGEIQLSQKNQEVTTRIILPLSSDLKAGSEKQ